MKRYSLQALLKWIDARQVRERVVLLGAGLGLLAMSWLVFAHDPIVAAKESEARNILLAQSRVADEQKRQNDIRKSYSTDPNAFATARERELRTATQSADARLNDLYGELISPRQMSQVLTTLLQRETMLNLVSLENRPSEALLQASTTAGTSAPMQVFKHGLRLVFEGDFIETVNYLRGLERLEGNFFWENLDFQMVEYPRARISLDIYTLSTEQGWIGV
jgi:MSHA biogenesis protein MshJ